MPLKQLSIRWICLWNSYQ